MNLLRSSARHSGVAWLALALLVAGCARLTAQTASPVLSPTSLSFTSAAGSSPTAQSLSVSLPTAGASYTATATSTGNWLSVTPASGVSPGSLSVAVNGQSLTAGSYAGFVTVTAGGVSTTIPVTTSATASGFSSLTASQSNLTYNFATGATTPLSRNVVLTTGSTQTGALSTVITIGTPGTIVSVTPPSPAISPTTPASVDVSVNPIGLMPGTYLAAVAFGAPGTGGTVVNLTINVGSASTGGINSNLQQISLNGQIGTTAPLSQDIQITAPGTTPLTFAVSTATTSCGSSWLSATPLNGSTPATVNVQLNPSALPAGTCQGTISLLATGSSAPVTIPVSFTLSAGTALTVPTTPTNFNYQIGGTVPSPQTVSISSGSTPLNFTLGSSGTPAFIAFTPTSATTPSVVQLSINPAALTGLAAGTYTNTVSVTSAGAANSPRTFPVTLTVTGAGGLSTIVPTLSSANFNFQIGQATPAAQRIQLSSNGAPLNYTVTSATTTCPGFFTVTPSTGSTFEAGAPGELTITPVTTGISAASACAGTVTVTIDGSTTAPLLIPVRLNASATALLNISPNAINRVAVAFTSNLITQNIALSSTDSTPLTYTATVATNPTGQTWLSVAPSSGVTPATLVVTLNQSGLPPGNYQGTITVGTGASSTPQIIPVNFSIVTAILTPSSPSLTFTQALAGNNPAPQALNLGTLPPGSVTTAIVTALNGTGWLSATTAGSLVTVSVNSAGLAEGTYRGVISVSVPGTSPSVLNVPVTFTLGNPSSLTVSPTTLTFAYTSGAATIPSAQTLQLANAGAAIPFSAVAETTTGGNWFTISPASGTTPGTLTVTPNPSVISGLASGSYMGRITISSSSLPTVTQVVNLNLTVASSATGTPTITSVVNAATSQAGAVAPGTIIMITGTNLGPVATSMLQLGANGLLLTTLADFTVLIDDIPAPLVMVSSTQINAVVPYEVAGKTSVNLVIRRGAGATAVSSAPRALMIAPTSPGILTLTMDGQGQGAILNQNGTINGPSSPSAPGSIIVVYGTGGGVMNPGVATGSVTSSTGTSFPQPLAAVSATVGGQNATVLYAGAAPGFLSGLMQFNLQLPSNLPTGPQPVILTIGGVSSRSGATVTIR